MLNLFVHLKKDSLLVKEGDHIVAGQRIATIGSSGRHLDFSIRTGSNSVNKVIGQTCYDPILFNNYYTYGGTKPCNIELDMLMNIPTNITNTCSDKSDGCGEYYNQIVAKYNLSKE